MKYCIETTRNHPVSVSHTICLENINDVFQRESKECFDCNIPISKNNEVVIDLDAIEALKAEQEGRDRNKSMDMAFGISNKEADAREILMVELRLNYKNPNNLNKAEIEGKVAGSILILSNHIPIHAKYIFIFKTKQIQEATNRLARMIPRINSNYVVMDIQQLMDVYF